MGIKRKVTGPDLSPAARSRARDAGFPGSFGPGTVVVLQDDGPFQGRRATVKTVYDSGAVDAILSDGTIVGAMLSTVKLP
jgi:hypothetical protein